MAYNPFDFFRRNQKLFFGGLTILVMFMFILSFGQGDFFSWFPQQIAKWQTTGEVMASIDGSQIKASQLQDVNAERGMANGYMLQAAGKALVESLKAADADSAAASADARDDLVRVLQVARSVQQFRFESVEQATAARVQLEREISIARGIEGRTGVRAEDAKGAKSVRVYAELVLGDLIRRSAGEKGEALVYFVNQPNRNERDRLEFLLWKKKADQLGIRFTRDHVAALVDAEFPSTALTPDDLKDLAQKAAANSGRKTSQLFDALADEFRVRAAQAAVIGAGEIRNPAADPPGTTRQRYEHFVKQTTATKYTFISIPVEAYLPLVQGEPTEAELQKIFNDASGIDPDPSSPKAGIREPRKVGVQWVEVTGKEPYYDALAVKRAQAIPLAQAVFGTPLASVAEPFKPVQYDDYLKGQGAITGRRLDASNSPGKPEISFAGQQKAQELGTVFGAAAVKQVQDDLLAKGGANVASPFASAADQLLDAEVVRPDVVAALVGLTSGAVATNGTPLAPPIGVTESAFRHSRERRVVDGIRAFRFPALTGVPELGEAVGGELAVMTASPSPLPEATVRPVLDRLTADRLQSVLATEDVRAFEKELTRIMKSDTPAAKADEKVKVREQAAKFVKDWIDLRQVKTGGTFWELDSPGWAAVVGGAVAAVAVPVVHPRDVYSLADDPGMKPLLLKDQGLLLFGSGVPKNVRAKTAFGLAFVQENTVSPMAQMQLRQPPNIKPATGLYQVREYSPSFRFSERQDYAPLVPTGPPPADDPLASFIYNMSPPLQVSPGGSLTLVWRTAEVPADRPLSLAASPAARDKCKAIWRLNKARDLARKAADEAARVIQPAEGQQVPIDKRVSEAVGKLRLGIADPLMALNIQERTLTDFEVADLTLRAPIRPFTPPTVAEFNPRDDSIVYESDKMADALKANKDKPEGSTFVFTDKPETTLFLTVVAGTRGVDPSYFRNYVLYPDWNQLKEQRQRVLNPAEVNPRFAAAARQADRKQAVALLKAEFNYKDENPKLDQTEQ